MDAKKGGRLSDEILLELRNKGGSKGGPPAAADDGDEEDKADGGADEQEEGDYGGDEVTIAGELADALKGGDPKDIAASLKQFLDVCVPKIVDKMKG